MGLRDRKILHQRFERHCDQEDLNPHAFIEQMTARDQGLTPDALHAWYFDGKPPSESGDADRIVEAVHRWLKGSDGWLAGAA